MIRRSAPLLAQGTSRNVVVQQLYGSASMHLPQAEAFVAAAERHLCHFAVVGIVPNP